MVTRQVPYHPSQQAIDTLTPFLKHVVLPAVAPLALVALYLTPKEVFGCANRGYLALGVILLATSGAIFTTIKGTALQRRGDREAGWWLASTVILLSAILLLFGPLR